MLARFLILSILAHAGLLLAWAVWWPHTSPTKTEEIRVSLLSAPPAAAAPTARQATPTIAAVASVPPAAPTLIDHGTTPRLKRPPVAPGVPRPAATGQRTAPPSPAARQERASEPGTVNHLRALLRQHLQQVFFYPPLARKYGWQGQVEVDVRLDADGQVKPIRIAHSSGHGILDRHALETLQRVGQLPAAHSWLRGRSYAFVIPITYRLTEG
jgi:protein TonB